MSSEAETWTPPAEGSPCWIEIPARDIQKLKVGQDHQLISGNSVLNNTCRRFTAASSLRGHGGLVPMTTVNMP